MPNAETLLAPLTVTGIDNVERPVCPKLLEHNRRFIRGQIELRRGVLALAIERGDKDVEKFTREWLASLYSQALSVRLDTCTLEVITPDAAANLLDEWSAALASDEALVAFGRREAGLV